MNINSYDYEINWRGPVFDLLGYARHNREMVFALDRAKVKINLIPTDPYKPYYFDKLAKYIINEPKDHLITISCIPTSPIHHDRGYAILYETIESLHPHPGLVRRSLEWDEIWVPSQYNLRAMKGACRRKIPINRVPEGIDTHEWNPISIEKNKRFTFVYLGDWSFRKGVHELVRAFTEEFIQEDVQLWLITKYHQTKNDLKSQEQIQGEAEESAGDNFSNLQKVKYFFENYSDIELRQILCQAHIFVMPTKGEAWCLPAMESMILGLPCILPKIGGHRDFFDKRHGWLTKGKWGLLEYDADTRVDFYDDQLFYLPDIKDLKKKMRYAFEHELEVRDKGLAAREHILKNFSWDHAARIAKKRITEIYTKGYDLHKAGHKLS